MELQKALQDFLDAHEMDNQSELTLKNYRRYVGPFIEWLRQEHSIVDTSGLDVTYLRKWIVHLQKVPNKRGKLYKDSTVNLYGVCMVAFCHWLEYEKVIPESVTERFKLPRVEKAYIPTFTSDEVLKLFAACEDSAHSLSPAVRKALTARNRAIVAILFDTGIRLSELVGLRLCDIDKDLRLLLVHRKGNVWQQVPVSREGFKYLHDYLTKYRRSLAILVDKEVPHKEDAVFLSRYGEPITVSAVESLFERLKKRTGIDGKRVSPHNCRRYMATSQLAKGRSPLDVQRQMGHTTLKMTNHYASLTTEQIQKSHEQFSPLRTEKNKQGGSGVNEIGKGYWEE